MGGDARTVRRGVPLTAMPTIITHAIVLLSAALALRRPRPTPPVALAGAVLAMLPDADVIGFRFGVAYDAAWGPSRRDPFAGRRRPCHGVACLDLAPRANASWPPPSCSSRQRRTACSTCPTNGGLGVALVLAGRDRPATFSRGSRSRSPRSGRASSPRAASRRCCPSFVLVVGCPAPCCLPVGWLIRRKRPAALT